FGGLGLTSSGYSRTIQELCKYDGSVAITAGAHSSIGMRGLLLFGTDSQKQKYLSKLASGEMIAAFCLTESTAGSDAAGIKTKATRDGDSWILNGEKLWITNGGIADFFTVFAKTEGLEGQMTAFIVTRDLPGVSAGPHEDKMGLRASCTTTVNFDNVRLTQEHLLGEVGKGFKVAMKILNVGRTGLGGGSIGAMKKSIHLASQHAKSRQQFGKNISEFGLIQQKLGHMVVECYVSEAVVSMVAGLSDRGCEDYAVEAAISKVFATECLWRTIDEALQVAGGGGYMSEYPYERIMRDCRINRIFEGTNDILRLFIALTAMNDVGAQLKEVAHSIGNVLQDPIKGFGVLSEYARKRVSYATGFGKATLSKSHPTVKEQAEVFEDCTKQLASFVDKMLRKYGKNIVGHQFATRRLADVMIDLFALASVLSRVTAAIEEKGVEATKREREILQVFAGQVSRRVRSNFNKIDDNDDQQITSLALDAVEYEGYRWDTI
ncbi:MAG: acyl-CoA dehydrogenase, partial [Deltaproteobacteria bacterium]|nr:acyl-CoA dehydrogenase [Deltaproteobacteria bacterium]